MPRPARRNRKAADRVLSKDAFELLHPDLVMSAADKQEWHRNQPGTIADEIDAAYAMAYNTGLSHEDATQAAQKAVYGKVRSDKVGAQNLQNVQIAQAARAVSNPNYGRYRNLFTQDSIKLEGTPQPAVLQMPTGAPGGLVSLTLAAQLVQGLVPTSAPQNEKLI